MTDRNKLAGDEFDTRDVLARMLAQPVESPWLVRALRGAASYLHPLTDDRESARRGADESWPSWWMRTNLDSGAGPAAAALGEGFFNTASNWLDWRNKTRPEDYSGGDTLAPLGMAAVGMPLTRVAARPALREWATPHMAERPYEWPVESAVKIGDRTFTGPSHFDAVTKAQAALGEDVFHRLLDNKSGPAALDGFITTAGRYVSREEAGRLLDERNQSNHFTSHWLSGRPKKGMDTLLSEGLENYNPTTGKEILADSSRASLPGTLVNSLAAANPQRHLDMSDAARAARAEEQGFTNTVYRATSEPKQGYTPNPKGDNVYGLGTYAADDPNWAKGFRSGQGAHVQELLGRSERPFIWDANDMAGTAARIKEIYPDAKQMQYGLPHDQIADWTKALKDAGYDAVRVISGEKPSGSTKTKTFDEWAFLNNNQLRSRDAAFDPALRDSGYLLAADNKTASLPGTLVNALSESSRREAPIVQFRKDAAAIEAGLPPVPEGHTRLWRGNRPGEVGSATSFTSDLSGIALPFRKSYGGPVSYVDVPTSQLSAYEAKAGAAPGVEFGLPKEIASQATLLNALSEQGRPTSLAERVNQLPQVPRREVLPSDFEIHRTPAGDVNEYWIARPPNAQKADSTSQVVATFDPKRGQVRINSSHLPTTQQGEGRGVAMYQRLIDEAHRLGYEVRSDAEVSRAAQRIYSALAKRGYEVKEHPHVTRNEHGTAEASGPVYTVWPRAGRLFDVAGPAIMAPALVNALSGESSD